MRPHNLGYLPSSRVINLNSLDGHRALNLIENLQKTKEILCKRVGYENVSSFFPSSASYIYLMEYLIKSKKLDIKISGGATLYAQKAAQFLQCEIFADIGLESIKAEVLIVPAVSEDLYEISDKEMLKDLQKNGVFIIVDASYTPCPQEWNFADMLIYHSAIFSNVNSRLFFEHNIDNLELLEFALKRLNNITREEGNVAEELFEALYLELGESTYLVSDPKITTPGAICIGFKGIKARDMMKALVLEHIYVINGEACFLGLETPSMTLYHRGVEEKKRREVLSISFSESFDVSTLAKRLAVKYRKIICY